jgi:hypothetical protein
VKRTSTSSTSTRTATPRRMARTSASTNCAPMPSAWKMYEASTIEDCADSIASSIAG